MSVPQTPLTIVLMCVRVVPNTNFEESDEDTEDVLDAD